jgi:hypothetical protein
MKQMLAALGIALGLAGCDVSPSQDPFGCDSHKAGVHQCIDYALESAGNGDLSGQRDACSESGGMVVSACDHTGAVGGCETFHPDPNGGQGQTVTVWFYSPMTSAGVTQTCGQGGYKFVGP